MKEIFYRQDIPKGIPKGIKKPEHKVRDIFQVQKCNLVLSRCKGTYFSANKQIFYCFFYKMQKKNGKTAKNRN